MRALSQRWLTAVMSVLCLGVSVPLGARIWAYEPFVCPGSSMFPAIHPGDRFVGERIEPGAVRRGDVVLARAPGDPEGVVVKRVLALPGDRIWVHDGGVELNGDELPRCSLGPLELVPGVLGSAYLESVGERRYVTVVYDGAGYGDRCVGGPCTIPEGELFLVGDNRDDSRDSRVWGSVPLRDVFGRALEGEPEVPEPLRDAYLACLESGGTGT
jgi:signal peptidase I